MWDALTRAIIAGADRIEALPEVDQVESLTGLSGRVRALVGDDDAPGLSSEVALY